MSYAHNIAIVSSRNPKDVVGILTVYAENVQQALKRVRTDPDMSDVRCYPYGDNGKQHYLGVA